MLPPVAVTVALPLFRLQEATVVVAVALRAAGWVMVTFCVTVQPELSVTVTV